MTARARITAAAASNGWTITDVGCTEQVITKNRRRIWVCYSVAGSVTAYSTDRRLGARTNKAAALLTELTR